MLLAAEPGLASPEQDIPKLALLFLTRGPMPHREVWGRWFQSVAGLVPKSALLATRAVCLRKCTKGGAGEGRERGARGPQGIQ